MDAAALLRKQFLEHFERKLIPSAADPGIDAGKYLICASARLASHPAAHALPIPPLSDAAQSRYPIGKTWPDARMHCIGFPYVACILEGQADLRVGITQAMAKKRNAEDELPGGYVLSLSAKDCLLIPPGVPFSTGRFPHWERPRPESARSRILWIHFLPVGALIHTCSTEGELHQNSYSLFVDNTNLFRMVELLLDEMREGRRDSEAVARTLWLAVLCRLRGDLASSMPVLTDGLHSRFPAEENLSSTTGLTSSLQIACDFIQLNLHEPLNPAGIAGHIAMTPTQLNRLFRKHLSQSIMGYVTTRRVETAKLLLTTSDLSMQEIAALVGFLQPSHFSQIFRAAEGISPLNFRQLKRSRTI